MGFWGFGEQYVTERVHPKNIKQKKHLNKQNKHLRIA